MNNKTTLGDPIVDPIAELLKHAFVLKVGEGNVSGGIELENLLDELLKSNSELDSTLYSVLRFLNCLKSLDAEDEEQNLVSFNAYTVLLLNFQPKFFVGNFSLRRKKFSITWNCWWREDSASFSSIHTRIIWFTKEIQ